ncbi:interferon-induced very large GTPase 1-like [Pecten maximus]|uniref:interferon-induced very large GTPase 1-like n=1 Tax=Pecten maximus TaxID=6579 RepID=UPI0014587FB8|nr:interferon-induced very large GTPase 1-like [Pecten maximus]
MSINDHEKEEAETLADIPRLILRKLIMLDFTSRENDLDKCLTKLNKPNEKSLLTEGTSTSSNTDYQSLFDCDDDTDNEPSSVIEMYNPLDIFLSIFVCLNPTLKQKVCLKMFACHLAIPLIFPVPQNKDQETVLMFSMWPLRSTTVHDGKTETSVVNCKQNVVSFIRLGRPPISKSKLANELLYDTAHHSFFNYDCTLGSSDKQASLGLVEASWFLPSPKQQSTFESVTMFLNLRGDAMYNSEQREYLKRVSGVMVVVTDIATMKNLKVLDFLKFANLNVLFLITGNFPNKNFIKKYKEYYMKSCPECFSAEFIHITHKGKNISLSEIKKAALNKIGPMLSNMSTRKTLHDMCKYARSMGLFVDEDLPVSRRGIELANTIFDKIKDYKLADIKTKFSPLQKEFWKLYTDAMKEFCTASYDLNEKDKLKQKMESYRKQQWHTYVTGNQFMKDIIDIVFELDGDELVHFLDALKFFLDEKSRTEMPFYRERFGEAWDKLQTDSDSDKDQARKNFDKAEQHLSEASFGIEHIFREMGQIYVASLTSNEKEFGSKLAKAVARSLLLGYPFELMDGDVANVPLEWIDRVFKELKLILKNDSVLSLSILGLQSSGKSTLLNAMFGLTFSVSAGRCTRGIYLQLLPVQKKGFTFSYVLVVDTEGLRAPELANEKCQHDNELATIVLGMADITLINIKGENTSEIKDILQICVHAFLRLKMANESLRLRQSCIFIHQNVSDVGAKDSMMHARKKLDETLDSITVEAAEEENISNVKAFKDVIHFDSNEHVWYFSDLWKGDPPMAPANPGYSRDVQEVKLCIFETLAKRNSSYLTISDTFVHIKDLWNGILANDFVFSFRNSLEIKAYNALESYYQELIWTLEKFTKTLENRARDEMLDNAASCKTDEDKEHRNIQFSKIQTEYEKELGENAQDLKEKLDKHFNESGKRDDIAKWKHVKLSSWDNFAKECLGKLKRQLVDMQSHCIADYEMQTSLEKSKKEIYGKATVLAEKMKGDMPSKRDMEKSFDVMWREWILGINVPEEQPIDIPLILESIIYEFFHKHRDIVDTEIKRHPLDLCKSFKSLENSLNDIEFDKNCISTKISWRGLKGFVLSESKNKMGRFTNIILRDIDTRLGNIRNKDWKFDVTEMKECLKCIVEHVDQFNHDVANGFTVLEPYKVKIAVHIFGRALPLLKNLDSEYKSKHSMKTKLIKHKQNVWHHFQDIVAERSATIIASNRFGEVIDVHVEEKVRAELPDLIFNDIVEEFVRSKHKLMYSVLEYLANKHDWFAFVSYIDDPHTYTFNWLRQFIDKSCVDKELYANNAFSKLKHIFEIILKSEENNSASSLDEWLVDFQGKIKGVVLIPMESFSVIKDQQITNLNDFVITVKDRLEQVHVKLKKKFKQEGSKTIHWVGDKTPYEMSMNKLWGCRAMCPFCQEPCRQNANHSGSNHECIQHRASSVSGRRWVDSHKLVLESCAFSVNSNHTFQCSGKQIRCDQSGGTEHSHPYREYRKYVPDWNIFPCNDISSSKYWAWVLCTFNEKFAKYYGTNQADIPPSWKEITKYKAIESLWELEK